jgi:hypothetical protein
MLASDGAFPICRRRISKVQPKIANARTNKISAGEETQVGGGPAATAGSMGRIGEATEPDDQWLGIPKWSVIVQPS